MSLFKELKRRNVIRIAGIYAVVAWILMQVAGTLEESLKLPEWFDSVVTAGLMIGFPIALLLAWAFEMTPEGMRRTEELKGGESISGSKFDGLILLGIVGVLGLGIWQQFGGTDIDPRSTIDNGNDQVVGNNSVSPNNNSVIPAKAGTSLLDAVSKSIAVLPFIDLSQDGDQEYFSDGISEEILNALVRIPNLKVAGRTSSFSFKGRNEDLRKISESLGVNHILEGSVRRSGTKLRITAQLIRGKDGFHLWSETYDREATDIFKIQDEIARAVAKQLALSLGLSSKNLVKDRTDDIIAYEKYLYAKQLYQARGADNLDHALVLLSEVVARDPDFVPAWTMISSVYSVYESYQTDEKNLKYFKIYRSAGLAAAQHAIEMDPENAEAYSSQGIFYSYSYQWIDAFKSMDKALELSSGDSDILDGIAQTMIDVGYFEEALKLSKQAVKNDPLLAIYRNALARGYIYLGNYKDGIIQATEMIKLNPKMRYPYRNLKRIYINQNKLDEAVTIITLAVNNGALKQKELDEITFIRDNRNNESELRKIITENINPTIVGIEVIASNVLNDLEAYLAIRKLNWDRDYRNVPYVFTGDFGNDLFNSPVWKEQIRKDGILKLWQSRGFPSQCRSLPDSDIKDDFECVVNKQDFQ